MRLSAVHWRSCAAPPVEAYVRAVRRGNRYVLTPAIECAGRGGEVGVRVHAAACWRCYAIRFAWFRINSPVST